MIDSVIPIYVVKAIDDVYIPTWNVTIVTLMYSPNLQVIQRTVISCNAAVELVAFGATTIFTVALVHKFITETRWRRTRSNITGDSIVSGRDKKFIQMGILIAVVFIISYIPSASATLYTLVANQLRKVLLTEMSDLVWPFAVFIESVNSAATMFIYLNMSSRYKAVFWDMFRRCLHTKAMRSQRKKSEKEIYTKQAS